MAASTSHIAKKMRDLHLSQPRESESTLKNTEDDSGAKATADEPVKLAECEQLAKEPMELEVKDQHTTQSHLQQWDMVYPRYPGRPITLPSGSVDYIDGTRPHAQRTVFKPTATGIPEDHLYEVKTITISIQPDYSTWLETYPIRLHNRYIAKRNALKRFTVDSHIDFVGYSVPKYISADDATRTLTLARAIFKKVVTLPELVTAAYVDTTTLHQLKETTQAVFSCAWQLGVRGIFEREFLQFGLVVYNGEHVWCPIIKGWSHADVRESDDEPAEDKDKTVLRELNHIEDVFDRYFEQDEEMEDAVPEAEMDVIMED